MHVPGRGSTINPSGRFERLAVEIEEEFQHEAGRPRTEYLRDESQSILTRNDSPDIGFDASLNPYRGCEHGCAYCYARPSHEFLGLSAGLDFETKIMVKMDAASLLRKELGARKWKPQVVAVSGITDCYQPVERKLEITRQCLKVFAEFRNPLVIVTKNHLVTRDIDILAQLVPYKCVRVFLSITSLDSDLASSLEPRASLPAHRLDAVRRLSEAGIPVGVLVAPTIPGLNEHEVPAILAAAREVGAESAGFTLLRLPYGVKDIFSAWLDTHAPLAKEKVLERIRTFRGGKLNDSRFGSRMKGEGFWADQIRQLFEVSAAREGLNKKRYELSTSSFRNPDDRQMTLF